MASYRPSLHCSHPSSFTLLLPHNQPRRCQFRSSTRVLYNAAHSFAVRCSSFSLPSSKDEAIKQAKTRLSSTLTKHLGNPRLFGKIKKLRQPRFQIEIPLIDDSTSSVSHLALDLLLDLPLMKKDSPAKSLILWPTKSLSISASNIFPSPSTITNHESIDSTSYETLRAADYIVFFVPEPSNLASMRTICERIAPKPVVILNPNWEFGDFAELGEFKGFAESFDVIYAFTGLSVQGILKTRKGMLFNSGEDEGEKWAILVEENGEMKTVSKFKSRPSMNEVSDVLYNVMAANSPLTKSAKFLKQLLNRKQ